MAGKVSIGYTVVDTNSKTVALTGNPNKLIKGHSNAYVNMTATSSIGAAFDLDFLIIRNGEKEQRVEGAFNNVTSNIFEFSAEDEYGNIGTARYVAPMVDYEDVTCQISNNAPDGNGNMTVSCSGTWFNGSFGAKTNTLKVEYRYAVIGSSAYTDWTSMGVVTSGNSYVADAYVSGLDYQVAYDFEVRATDELTSQPSNNGVSGTPIFHWGKQDVTFEVPVVFNSNTVGISYNDLTDKPEIPDISNMPNVEASAWDLYLFDCGNPSYSARVGWYSRINNVVTVGFYIKADISSGYHANNVQIGRLPYQTIISASGGGICSGTYTASDQNFQCFVADGLNHVISVRTQMCNTTTSSNSPNYPYNMSTEWHHLKTSAGGCCYPVGGGEITLSGTITYLAAL